MNLGNDCLSGFGCRWPVGQRCDRALAQGVTADQSRPHRHQGTMAISDDLEGRR